MTDKPPIVNDADHESPTGSRFFVQFRGSGIRVPELEEDWLRVAASLEHGETREVIIDGWNCTVGRGVPGERNKPEKP